MSSCSRKTSSSLRSFSSTFPLCTDSNETWRMFIEKYHCEFFVSFRFVSFRSTNDLSICSGRQYCRSQSVGQHQLLRFIARNDRFEYRTGRGKTLLNACFSLHVFVSHLSEYSRIEITGWIRSIKSRKFGCAGKKSLFRTLSYSRTTRNISIGQFTRSRDR